MDPISIISTVGAVSHIVYQVSTTLHTFIQATKNVDQSVKFLYAEIDGLHRVLDAISSSLTNPIIRSTTAAAQGSNKLWSSFDGSLSDCRQTAQALHDILESVKGTSVRRNPFKLSIRQIKLNLNEDDIKNIRSQIHTHNMNLQMALQTINVHVSCMSPDRVIDDISPKIERLAEMITNFQLPQIKGSESWLPARIKSEDLLRHTERVKQSAEAVLSSASSVVEAESVRGGLTERNFSAESEYGVPLSSIYRSRIEDWIAPPDIAEEPVRANNRLSATQSQQEPFIFSGPSQTTSEVINESDSDEDVDFEGVQGFLAKGIEKYNEKSFTESEKILRHGLKVAQTLSFKRRSLLNFKDIQLKVALACLQQGKLDESEQVLLTLVEEHAINEQDSACILSGSHALAQVYVRKGNLDKALAHCRKAVVGRRRTLGNRDPYYYDSLNLLASIYRAMDDPTTAAIYANLVPLEFSTVEPSSSVSVSEPSEIVEIPLEEGATIINENDGNLLIVAASNGHLEVVKLLLEKGATVADIDKDGWTPLTAAANSGHLEMVKFLLEKGASITSTSEGGWTPLTAAASEGHIEVVELLLEKGASITGTYEGGWTPLIAAAYNGHLEMVKLLLEKGASITGTYEGGWTPLTAAANNGHLEVVKLLVEKGASITGTCEGGWTPLNLAASEGHIDVVKLLLEKGASVIVPNKKGLTPLHVAASDGHLEVVKLLLENGASIIGINRDDQAPLTAAASEGHLEVVKLLLEKGATIADIDKDGWTPLTAAAYNGHLEVVKFLLDEGADCTIANNNGKTPLFIATHQGHTEIVKTLLEKAGGFQSQY